MLYNWFQHIEFAYPWAFALFLLLPLMIWWYMTRYRQQQAVVMISTVLPLKQISSWKNLFRHALLVFRLLAISCLIVALARPQVRNDEELKTGEGIDIMLCLDVSGSMRAQDLLPNRLEAAKQVAAEFVDTRPTDRIGVVIFAGESFTLVPLTTDKSVLKSQLYNIELGVLEDGTAIGDGLGVSVARLKNSPTKSKIIILLTDGKNEGGRISPLAGKDMATANNIRVYSVGVGTEGYAPVPVAEGPTGTVIRQQKVNLDEGLLRQIAEETGGLYFRARDNESLKGVYSEIDKLEKSRIEVTTLKRYTEKFFPFAFAAAGLLLLELILRYTLFRKFP